jgi:hypothetical protein
MINREELYMEAEEFINKTFDEYTLSVIVSEIIKAYEREQIGRLGSKQ